MIMHTFRIYAYGFKDHKPDNVVCFNLALGDFRLGRQKPLPSQPID